MQDKIMQEGAWVFDDNVASVFDDMLERSIPQYKVMRSLVDSMVRYYAKPDTAIIDLGTSLGGALHSLDDLPNHLIGVDVSEPMIKKASENPRIDTRHLDLRTDYPTARSSVTLSILTLQFTPLEYRQNIIKKIYNNLVDGGVLIYVEKVIGESQEIDAMMVDLYYDFKRANGYTEEQIQNKRASLEGVLVPLLPSWNQSLLTSAGFSRVDGFWRWLNFMGWVAIK